MSEQTGTEDQDAMAAEWAAAMGEQAESGAAQNSDLEITEVGKSVISMESAPSNLDVVLDIPVRISMEVGNTQIPIRQLLKLTRGSIVELDRLAGEPLDVLINGTLIAHGEVVVINEKFGIRLTDVLSPADRIKTLR